MKRLGALLFTIFLLAPAFVRADTFTIDAVHTTIGFRIKHLMISHVTGTFDKFEGTVDWDGKTLADAQVAITIQAAGINTRNEKRDKHLRNADFFDVEKFPTISFKSKRVVITGKDTAQLIGDLTIKGVTKEVTLDVKHLGTIPVDPWKNIRAGFSATLTIDRRDFGIVPPGPAGKAVGNEVAITIDVEIVKPVK